MSVPGSPIAYWVSESVNKAFACNKRTNDYFDLIQGMITGNNDRFVRAWQEISSSKFSVFSKLRNEWVPYNKGGEARKWYGNQELVVDWSTSGTDFTRNRNTNCHLYFRPYVSWSYLNSGVPAARYYPEGFLWDVHGSGAFPKFSGLDGYLVGLLCSKVGSYFLSILNPTMSFQVENISALPWDTTSSFEGDLGYLQEAIQLARNDWDLFEVSWDFTTLPLLHSDYGYKLSGSYAQLRTQWQENTLEMQRLEEENNRIFIDAYGLQDELTPEVPLNEITLTCNPHYRYRLGKQWDGASEEERNAELERQLQSDTLCELISYAIGCMMGRYSIDQPGLILASQGETLQDYLERVPNPRFLPDDDAIVPLTDQEWFADDATHRVREFVRTVWGEQHLQENLDFIAESLCLSAIRPRKGESSLDCIRRYLSTQFYKDHMRTYKKRPIYWLFSSGKLKAFECLVYLHRYTEGTLARMRTEYVIPLTARLHSHGERLEEARANSTSAAETKRLEKELDQLHKQQAELAEFDEQLRHYADQRIRLDLDDGVKVNYGKFGDLLADVKAIAG